MTEQRVYPNMGRTILFRTAKDVDEKKPARLMCLLGLDYIDWIDHFLKEDKQIAYYIWAKLFEQTNICGESGIHRHILDITIDRSLMELYNKKAYPTAAVIAVTLDEYDNMREEPRVWQTIGKLRDPIDFPKYERL